MRNVLEWLRGAANDKVLTSGSGTRSNATSGAAGNGGGGNSDHLPAQGDEHERGDGSGYVVALDDAVESYVAAAADELRAAITVELDQLRDRLDRADREARDLKDEWHDALAKFAKIGNRLAAQARRDLERASRDIEGTPLGDEQGQFSMLPPPPLPPNTHEPSREERKAALRHRIQRGA
jgi:hypothetical protein